jgi:hypothetical protein
MLNLDFKFISPSTGYSSIQYREFVDASYVAYLYHGSTLYQMFPKSPVCHAYAKYMF